MPSSQTVAGHFSFWDFCERGVGMKSIGSIPVKTIKGDETSLSAYQGKVLLVVNVASKCGLTPQYEGLEKIYREYKAKGLEIVGFPANNFMGQEPGTNEEIAQFCKMSYDVTFPIFQKISVKGENQHPLYAALTQAAPRAEGDAQGSMGKRLMFGVLGMFKGKASDISWNFEKFLIDRNGKVARRFAPTVLPDSALIKGAIEKLL